MKLSLFEPVLEMLAVLVLDLRGVEEMSGCHNNVQSGYLLVGGEDRYDTSSTSVDSANQVLPRFNRNPEQHSSECCSSRSATRGT